jgi:hypothetical protein
MTRRLAWYALAALVLFLVAVLTYEMLAGLDRLLGGY